MDEAHRSQWNMSVSEREGGGGGNLPHKHSYEAGVGWDVWGGVHPWWSYRKSKTYGVAADGEAHLHIEGRGIHRRIGSGYPYAEDMDVGADLRVDTGVLGFWDPRMMCDFDVCVVDMDEDTYAGTQQNKVLA